MAAEKQVLKYDCATVNNLLDTVNENKALFPFDTALNASSQKGLPNSVITKEINALKDATSNNKGYFLSLEKLKAAYPTANEGSKAYVGSNYPYQIYLYETSMGGWHYTDETGGDDTFNAGEFYTRTEIDQQHEVINNQIARVEKGANYEVLEYETSIATTRLKVKEDNRKGGYMITYNPGTGWIKEQYIGELTDNEEWIKDENWKAEVLDENIQAIAENAQQQADLAAANAALAEEKATEAATQAAYAKEQGNLIANFFVIHNSNLLSIKPTDSSETLLELIGGSENIQNVIDAVVDGKRIVFSSTGSFGYTVYANAVVTINMIHISFTLPKGILNDSESKNIVIQILKSNYSAGLLLYCYQNGYKLSSDILQITKESTDSDIKTVLPVSSLETLHALTNFNNVFYIEDPSNKGRVNLSFVVSKMDDGYIITITTNGNILSFDDQASFRALYYIKTTDSYVVMV